MARVSDRDQQQGSEAGKESGMRDLGNRVGCETRRQQGLDLVGDLSGAP